MAEHNRIEMYQTSRKLVMTTVGALMVAAAIGSCGGSEEKGEISDSKSGSTGGAGGGESSGASGGGGAGPSELQDCSGIVAYSTSDSDAETMRLQAFVVNLPISGTSDGANGPPPTYRTGHVFALDLSLLSDALWKANLLPGPTDPFGSRVLTCAPPDKSFIFGIRIQFDSGASSYALWAGDRSSVGSGTAVPGQDGVMQYMLHLSSAPIVEAIADFDDPLYNCASIRHSERFLGYDLQHIYRGCSSNQIDSAQFPEEAAIYAMGSYGALLVASGWDDLAKTSLGNSGNMTLTDQCAVAVSPMQNDLGVFVFESVGFADGAEDFFAEAIDLPPPGVTVSTICGH